MVKVSGQDLKNKLTSQQYHICVEGGTEAPFTGRYLYNKKKGTYNCAVCAQPLFPSKTKYESGTGWPSFWDVIREGTVKLQKDTSLGMIRTEVVCANCGAHLGHVFDDLPADATALQAGGPKEKTGKRYCINSAALDFKAK